MIWNTLFLVANMPSTLPIMLFNDVMSIYFSCKQNQMIISSANLLAFSNWIQFFLCAIPLYLPEGVLNVAMSLLWLYLSPSPPPLPPMMLHTHSFATRLQTHPHPCQKYGPPPCPTQPDPLKTVESLNRHWMGSPTVATWCRGGFASFSTCWIHLIKSPSRSG